MKLRNPILVILLLLPVLVYSQDTSKIAKALKGRANPELLGLSGKEACKKIGTEVYIRDTIYDYKIINNSYTILYVGDKNIQKALQIVLIGDKVKSNSQHWKNTLGHFSGKIILYKKKPAIIINDPDQLDIQIGI